MYISQSFGQHTLALFSQDSFGKTGNSQPDLFKAPQIASPSQIDAEKPSFGSDKFRVSEERMRNPQTAADREFVERTNRYSDTARQAKLVEAAYARHEASQQFQQENGYRNELSTGLYIAQGMAVHQKPSEAHFDNRERAIDELSNRMGGIESAERRISKARDFISVPTALDASRKSDFRWNNYNSQEAESALADLSAEGQFMASEKRSHDLKVSSMRMDIAVAELVRDFGVGDKVFSKDADGRVELNDFDIVSSKFGKLGEVRDGQFYLVTEDGESMKHGD